MGSNRKTDEGLMIKVVNWTEFGKIEAEACQIPHDELIMSYYLALLPQFADGLTV